MKERETEEQLSASEQRKRLFLMHLRKRMGNGKMADITAQILRGLMQ